MEKELKTKGSMKEFIALLRQLKWPKGITAIALVLALFSTVASLAIPLVTKELVDSLTEAAFNWQTAVFLFVVFIVQAVLGGVSYYLLAYIGETIVADLRSKIWRKVLRLPVAYYDENETGETMSRITQDTTVLKQLVSDHLVSFITGIISIIGAVAILLYLDWKMTLIMLISIPVSMAIIFPLGTIMHKIAKGTQGEMAKFSGHLGRVLGDIRLVKSYRAEPNEGAKGDKAIQTLFSFGLKEAKNPSDYFAGHDARHDEYFGRHFRLWRCPSCEGRFVCRNACCNHLFNVSDHHAVCANGTSVYDFSKSCRSD